MQRRLRALALITALIYISNNVYAANYIMDIIVSIPYNPVSTRVSSNDETVTLIYSSCRKTAGRQRLNPFSPINVVLQAGGTGYFKYETKGRGGIHIKMIFGVQIELVVEYVASDGYLGQKKLVLNYQEEIWDGWVGSKSGEITVRINPSSRSGSMISFTTSENIVLVSWSGSIKTYLKIRLVSWGNHKVDGGVWSSGGARVFITYTPGGHRKNTGLFFMWLVGQFQSMCHAQVF